MNKITDAEIEKALLTVAYGGHSCNKCKYKYDKGEVRCGLKGCKITRDALDYINRLKAENEDLFYKLSGVMLSVDKWLEGDELNGDEVQRAADMREKTLQITEQQQAENEKLTIELQAMRGSANSYKAENERLNELVVYNASCATSLHKELFKAKAEAITEFAERLCKDRVLNDPVVIAVKAELKMTENEGKE